MIDLRSDTVTRPPAGAAAASLHPLVSAAAQEGTGAALRWSRGSPAGPPVLPTGAPPGGVPPGGVLARYSEACTSTPSSASALLPSSCTSTSSLQYKAVPQVQRCSRWNEWVL